MNSFILQGNICYSISKTELKTLSGYVVCSDGKCAGGQIESIFRAITDAIGVSKMYLRCVDENTKAVTFEEAFYMATKLFRR